MDSDSLRPLPDNVQIYPSVNQLDILSKANVFITHCGMNSVSESLFMATPMVLYPQTSEQKAVAGRVAALHAGVDLCDDSEGGIRSAVHEVLMTPGYALAAGECSADFRSCPRASGAADFIENAPHPSNGFDMIKALNRENRRFRGLYWAAAAALMVIIGIFTGWKHVWIVGVAAGVLSDPVGRLFQKKTYTVLLDKHKAEISHESHAVS